MAFTSGAVFEVWATGNDASGGGFDTGVAGFPTDGAATVANTSAPVFTSASYNFVAGDVGAWIYVKSGTNWIAGWYKIASVAANAATLDAAIGHAVLANGTPSTATGCAATASPTAATWGIDYSQQASAQIAYSDLVIGATTTQFTSAAHPVGKNLVGNIINITGGTGFTVQRVVVVSTSGTTATCDKTLGTAASTGGGNLGGALASPGLTGSLTVAGAFVFVKQGSYSITSASTGVASGCVSLGSTLRLEGYGTVRGDLAVAPVLTASGISTAVLVTMGGSAKCRCLTVDGASLTSIRGFAFASGCLGYLLTGKNCTNNAFSGGGLIKCVATGAATAAAYSVCNTIMCEAYSNSVTGFSNGTYAFLCLSYNNSGASSDGFAFANTGNGVSNCVSYNNGRDGFRFTSNNIAAANCIAEGNTGTGFNFGGDDGCALINCAVYSNGTNLTPGSNILNISLVTGTASFFVAASSGNFALNANAGGGALLRAAGIPGVTLDGLSTGYADIGAIQSPPLYPPARAFTRAA